MNLPLTKRLEDSESVKYLTKVLLFEDIDTVFADEPDFYSSLSKLLMVTKVPIVLTASNHQYINKHLLPILNKNKELINFECMHYSVRRPKSLDLFTICLFIKFFEGYIPQSLDQLLTVNN